MENPKRVTLGWTDTPPVLDGVMDDPGWLEGGLVTDLKQVLPVSGDEPTQRTEIRIVTDGKTLFVGFRCYDSNPEEIIHRRMKRDTFPFFDDRIGFSIDTFHTRRNGYFFATNPNAMRHDVLLEAENFEISWDTIWFVETSIDAEGWTAEIAIPFSSIAFDPRIDTWGINFERGIRRNDESLRWSDQAPQRLISSMGVAGVLDGVWGLDQGIGLEITPGITTRRIDDQNTDDRFEFDPTFDGFYKILPSVTAAMTYNTDFGQVESDDIQIQDDRFALFFPEKRDFFLEDGLIFDFGGISQNGRPFFSRRIGFNRGGPVSIQTGGKLTGRLGRVKFGVLDTFVEHKNGTDERNLFVGRAAVNVLGESTLGAIVTRGNPDGGRGPQPGSGITPKPNEEGRNSTTIGTDFLYRDSSFMGGTETFRASLWFAKSIDDNRTSNGRNHGYGIKLEYPNDRFNWIFGFEELQEDYHPRLGFVNRNDVRHWFGFSRYRTRPESGPFRTIDNEFFGEAFIDNGNDLETVNFRFVPVKFTTAIDDGIDFRYRIRYERVADPIPTFDIPDGVYTFHEGGLKAFTSRNRPVRVEFEVGYGTFFDGTRTRVDLDLEYRPSHYLFVEVAYEYRDVNLPQAGSMIPGSTGRNDRDTQLLRLKMDLLFTPNLAWSNFVQYDNRSDSAGINSRLRYIIEDGREFFVVFNQGIDTSTDDLDRTRAEAIIKAVWTLTF
ncbi:MAG: carbohydrate binding family 9 domain-containing protein [bacterium]|nr:carbohydrate binding family 9 domain-containing protein [bacterium]